jgi:hypothetical protein
VFALGFTLVVIVLWARFALGSMKLDVPLDSLQLSRGRTIWTRLLSVGFLVAALAPNVVSTSSLVRLLIDPLPLGVLFCVPGLLAIHRLRAHLETQGNPAKPAMACMARSWHSRRLERALSWLSLVALVLSSRPASPVIRGEAILTAHINMSDQLKEPR